MDFNEYSDHAPISFQIKLKLLQSKTTDSANTETFINRKIVFDSSKTDLFHRNLENNNGVIQRLTIDVSSEPLDHVVQDFTRFLHDKAFDVFGKTSHSKSHSNRHVNNNNKWFDENCQNAKRGFKTARNVLTEQKQTQRELISLEHARDIIEPKKKELRKNLKLRKDKELIT